MLYMSLNEIAVLMKVAKNHDVVCNVKRWTTSFMFGYVFTNMLTSIHFVQCQGSADHAY